MASQVAVGWKKDWGDRKISLLKRDGLNTDEAYFEEYYHASENNEYSLVFEWNIL